MGNQVEKLQKEYRNALTVFLNLATGNVNTWLKKLLPDASGDSDAIKRLRNEKNAEAQTKIFDSAIKHFSFLRWLYNERLYFVKPNNEAAAAKNYPKLMAWMELLYNLRNFCSHVDHDEVRLSGALLEDVNDLLVDLYLQACAECTTSIPNRYKGTAGVNRVKTEKNAAGDYDVKEVTPTLSLTGTVFYACLFLDGGQINNFLESMEQSSYTIEELNDRMEHRKNRPDAPYPENLSRRRRDFLYARDVYKHWQLRGHRTSITTDAALDEKEDCFGMLEYLKRCPREALKLSGAAQDKRGKAVFDGYEYDVREKDKFFDWALAFWDEEMRRLDIADWRWARHQATEKVQDAKNALEQKEQEAGRPYHFPRYQKVAFDIPQNPEERLNYRNDEHGFTYFLLKADKDENVGEVKKADETAGVTKITKATKATKAMFRYRRSNGKMVIGLMSGRLLCSVLEWYFLKFPVDQQDQQLIGKKEFWMKFFHACFEHIENTQRTAKTKENVSKKHVKERIDYLRKQYDADVKQQHPKMQFILSTWNQIISYGRDANMEHAMRSKSGHRELLRYLSLMSSSVVDERRRRAHKSLIEILENLGKSKSDESYFKVINNAFSKYQISSSTSPLNKALTVDAHFDLCKQYRKKMLDEFGEKLAAAFNVDDWRPIYEMRWLGLSDARTSHAAHGSSATATKALPQTNIVNVDSGSYPAAGLPRDVRHLAEAGWQNYLKIQNEGCVEKIHPKIYPSPSNCTLLIPAFFRNATYTPSSKHSCSIRDHKRLYLIRRQDTVISHIVYKKWRSVMGKSVQGLTLQNMDYQKMEFDVPVGGIRLRFYYRHFKQNRYQLPPKLTEKICRLLKSKRLVQDGCIDFNCLKPRSKYDLTLEEQYQRLPLQQKQALSADQKETLRKEYFERMNPIIFEPVREKGKLYFDEILQSYTICRREMIDKTHQLERNNKISRKVGARYTDFKTYIKNLVDSKYIDSAEGKKLSNIRNAAFHGDIPEENDMPQSLVKKVKGNPDRQYFDYFGEGISLIDKILDKLTVQQA
jgi:hypothetical protein